MLPITDADKYVSALFKPLEHLPSTFIQRW